MDFKCPEIIDEPHRQVGHANIQASSRSFMVASVTEMILSWKGAEDLGFTLWVLRNGIPKN